MPASILLFSTLSLTFLGLGLALPRIVFDSAVYVQFLPSLLKFWTAAALTAAGFIFIIMLTLGFGRVYCSFLCPLGVLQDIIAFGRKKRAHRKYAYKRPHPALHYGILAGVLTLFLSGSVTGVILTDPYSNFGRIMTHIIRPAAVWLNNTLVYALSTFDVYALFPIDPVKTGFFPVVFSLAVLALVFWMSFFHGRLFCNTICPVGAFLGLLSRFSLFKIGFDDENCITCRACERVCKAGCINLDAKEVDFSRCVSCYNCFSACPGSGIGYRWRVVSSEPAALKDPEKRKFILTATAFWCASNTTSGIAQQPIESYRKSTVPVPRQPGITPPGSFSLANYTRKCTACQLCVAACPTQVLQPAFLEYGLSGIMQPRMDYGKNYCNFDCVACSTVCPTGAIVPQKLDAKKTVQLGTATFIQKNCIVYTQKTDCGACAEHCPTKAVRMVLDTNTNKSAPRIDEAICVGCGACEFACPTKPYKAIYVKSNAVHKTAKKPESEAIPEESAFDGDFPF
ncbi:MAG: 4Fe-4S binding protein [Desulfobacterales bacterium]